MVDNIKIMSLNCRGLGNTQKRKDVLNYLRQKKYSIYCLQDTHFTHELENHIRSEWWYEIYIVVPTVLVVVASIIEIPAEQNINKNTYERWIINVKLIQDVFLFRTKKC